MKYLLFLIFAFILSFGQVFAQVDSTEFNVRIFGGNDVIPPTVPTLLTIDPVAPTQIDITWSASTDDFALAGYSVTRDGTPIATTTQLSYSDTGLAPSTTYAYTVRAFDASFNYSAPSNMLATTTPDLPVVPPPSTATSSASPSGGTVARVVVDTFTITPGVSTTTIHLTTARPSRIELRWGRSASYELGYIVRDAFSAEHRIELNELEPGTSYEYELVGYTPFGAQTVLGRGSFTTESPRLTTAPANVKGFTAVAEGRDVRLSWSMPNATEVAWVRVVRNHLGFPEYPQDGAIVYQGLNQTVLDAGVLDRHSPVYYTAFVYDTDGNVSSGAITLVYAPYQDGRGDGAPAGESSEPPVGIGDSAPTEEATTTIDQERVTPEMRMPTARDIALFQGGSIFTLDESDISLDPTREYFLSVPRETVAGNLKSIIVTVVDVTDQRQRSSYLLRINKDQSAYEAVLPPMGVVGRSRLVLEIYDYEAYVVAKYQTPIVFSAPSAEQTREVVFPDAVFDRSNVILLGITLLFVITLVLLLVHRLRGEDNE